MLTWKFSGKKNSLIVYFPHILKLEKFSSLAKLTSKMYERIVLAAERSF
jgi:hypothetical protein